MPVKIRLQRKGRKKQPFYHIVVADSRAPRDGRYIENIGSYNPMTTPATILLDVDKALDWLDKGAQPTDTTRAILRFKGVLYKKHLMRGLRKGALTQEKVDELFKAYMADKNARITARFEETKAAKSERNKLISGQPKAVVVETVEEVESIEESAPNSADEAVAEAEEAVSGATDDVVATAEAVVAEVVEDTAELVGTEAPEASSTQDDATVVSESDAKDEESSEEE